MLWNGELPTLLFTLTLVVYLGVVTGEWSTRAMHDHSPLLLATAGFRSLVRGHTGPSFLVGEV